MRLPLAIRVTAVLGGSLVLLQLLMGQAFFGALEEAENRRMDTLRMAARSAMHYAISMEAARQRESLETFADLSRKNDSKVLVKGGSRKVEAQEGSRAATTAPPLRGFFDRLFRRKSETPASRPRPATPSAPSESLASRVIGLEEYADAYPTIWHRVNSALPALDEPLRRKARQIEADTVGFAQRMVCQQQDCLILSVRPFQTRDGAQIMAVEGESLKRILAGLGSAGGFHLAMVDASEQPVPSRTLWLFEERIGELQIEEPGFALSFSEGASASQAPHLLVRYHVIGGLGIVVSLLLILLILRPLLRRVTLLRQALSELPHGNFAAAHALLGTRVTTLGFRDETTDLIAGADDIVAQIDQFQSKVREQATELLHERDHFQSLLNTMPAAVFVLEPNGVIVSGNQTAQNLLRLEPKLMAGRMIGSFLGPSHRGAFSDACRLAGNSAEKSVHEFELVDSDGRSHQMEWHMLRIPGEGPLRLLTVAMDITQLRDSERRLTWLRTHDEMTELLNRQAVIQRLCSRHADCVLVLIRPENESALIDTFEQEDRDQLLRELSGILRRSLGGFGSDNLGYLGKFRFVVLLSRARSEVEGAIASIMDALEQTTLRLHERRIEIGLQASCMELDGNPAEQRPLEQLETFEKFSEAQGETLKWLSPEVVSQEQSEHYRTWVERLQEAFRKDAFQLYFQPVYDAFTLEPLHSEVLVRLVEDDGRVITPDQFLRAAEQSGQMRRLDRQIFDRTVEKALQLQQQGIRHPLAVNVSAPELQQSYLLDLLEHAVHERGLEPGSIMIELVETHALESLGTAIGILERYSSLGFPILLDDFGVGFTSFEYLRELPFEYVKIDRTFVHALVNRMDDRRLIQSIHEMVRGLRRHSIAEGVEDVETLDILRGIGIDAIQGFGLARPAPEIRLERATIAAPARRPGAARKIVAAQSARLRA